MTKRYAVRTLRLAAHKRRRAALGRKLNLPKDRGWNAGAIADAVMPSEAECDAIKQRVHAWFELNALAVQVISGVNSS